MNKQNIILPTAVYGKVTHKERVPSSFNWIKKDNDFPELAYKFADDSVRSFQWSSQVGPQTFDPVVCWYSNIIDTNDGIILRFFDNGEDDRGRPHTLRVEAAYLQPALLQSNPDILVRLLTFASNEKSANISAEQSQWHLPDSSEVVSINAVIGSDSVKIQKNGLVITERPTRFNFRPLKPVIFLESKTFSPFENPLPSYNTSRNQTSPKENKPKEINNKIHKSANTKIIHITWCTVCVTLIACFTALHMDIKKNSQLKISERDETIKKLKENLTDKDNNISELEKKIKKNDDDLLDKNTEIDRLNQDIDKYEKNRDQATQQRLKTLKNLETTIEKFYQDFKSIQDANQSSGNIQGASNSIKANPMIESASK